MNESLWQELVPEVKLRSQQIEALNGVHNEMFVNNKRVVVLEAPTGVGKSIIQLALCRYVHLKSNKSSYIVTPQRILQDQMKGWRGLRVMKGKGSYECTLMPSVSASNAPCNLNPGIRESNSECAVGSCPYFTALDNAKSSHLVVHNYASLLAQARIGKHFTKRGLLCLDEGHTAASWIRNYMTCDLTPDDVMSLVGEDPPSKLDLFFPWLKWNMMELNEDELPKGMTEDMRVNIMKMLANRDDYGITHESDMMTMWDKSGKKGTYESFSKKAMLTSGKVPWTTQWNEPDRWNKTGSWSTIPLRVAPMAGVLTGMGEKVLIVTATMLNLPLFRLELGLSQDDISQVIVDKAFPVENRPVQQRYVGSMSFKHKSRTLPKLLNEIVKIASKHEDQQGIVHTVSHSLKDDVVNALSSQMSGRPVYGIPKGSDREDTIHRFLSGALGPNAILIGPALMEGVDGKDDSARWQVMCKVPWPYMKDPVIQRLMNSPKPNTRKWANKWYIWKTVQQTVQGMGRVCRSNEDYGITYLLDSGFRKIINSGYMPQYVLQSITKE